MTRAECLAKINATCAPTTKLIQEAVTTYDQLQQAIDEQVAGIWNEQPRPTPSPQRAAFLATLRRRSS